MLQKKMFVLIIVFLMIGSFSLSIYPNQAITNSQATQSSESQVNSCPIYVIGQKATIPIDYDSINHIYILSEYDFNLTYDSQTVQDYVYGTGYSGGIISNISLADNTAIAVVAHNSKTNNVDLITDFCINNSGSGSNSFGVHVGDWLNYAFFVNTSNMIPFFGYSGNNPVIRNGDTLYIGITQVQNGTNGQPAIIGFDLKINDSIPWATSTNDPSFIFFPLEFVQAIASGNFYSGPNNTGPVITYIGSDSVSVTFEMTNTNTTQGPIMDTKVTVDLVHGTLMYMDGFFKDPQNNTLEMTLKVLNTSFNNGNNSNPPPVSNTWGVTAGDSFTYFFSTNATGKIPFFGLNNNSAIIQNGDKVVIDIYKVAPDQAYAKITIGSYGSFELGDPMFLIVPLNVIEAITNSSTPIDQSSDGPSIQVLNVNSDNVTVRMYQVDNNTNTIVMDFSVTIDRHIGNLILLDGYSKDPSGNTIKMTLSLESKSIVSSGSTSSASSSDNNIVTSSLGGFEIIDFFALLPFIAIIPIINRSRRSK